MTTTILDTDHRRDLVDAHRGVIEALGRPGAWWDATERITIAAEVRRALAVWRVTNHPGTLTEDWYAGIVEALPSPFRRQSPVRRRTSGSRRPP